MMSKPPPKWAAAARARDDLILRTLSEVPTWWDQRIQPRLVREDGCLICRGALDGRYPVVSLPVSITSGDKVVVKVHRVAYLRAYGSIPFGLTLDHLCQETRCCEVDHLDAVTQQANMLRSERMDRSHVDWVARSEDLVRAYLGGVT